MSESTGDWYAVRCLFDWGVKQGLNTTYEERITLWRASSADEAVALAEAEALNYAAEIEDARSTCIGFAQSYRLFDEPGEGAELFSLLRDSTLGPEAYLDRFFDTGSEHQR